MRGPAIVRYVHRWRAFRHIDKVRRLAAQGDFDRATIILRAQRTALDSLRMLPHEREFHLAENLVTHAEMEFSRGDLTSAFAYYEEAVAALEKSPQNARNLGRVLHDEAVTLTAAQAPLPVVVDLLTRARKVLTPFGRHYCDDIDAYLDFFTIDEALGKHGGDLGSVEDVLVRVRERIDRMPQSVDRCRSRGNLASLLLSSATPSHWDEAQGLMYEALRYLREDRDVPLAVDVMSPLRLMAVRDIRLSPQLLGEVEHLLAVRQPVTNSEHRLALLEIGSALAYRAGRGQWDSAMTGCLSAMAIADREAARTQSTMVRAMTRKRAEFARHLAMTMASDCGDPALVLECTESARLQVVPTLRASDAVAEQELSTMLAETGGVVLSPLRMLSVGSVASRLRPFHEVTDVCAEDFDLVDFATAVGGADAWLWSATVIDMRYFWTVLGPDGRLTSGYEDLSPEFAPLFRRALDSTYVPRNPYDLLFRLYGAVPAEEEEASLKLGEMLIPPPLLAALTDPAVGAAADRPRPIVVASNFLAAIPVCLLAWRQGATVVRILERATLRWAPPAAIVKELLDAPLYPVDSHPVLLSCIDPDNTLPHARELRDPAPVSLRYQPAGVPDAPFSVRPATRRNLISALRDIPQSAPGTFFYSGHSEQGTLGLDGGLAMQDGPLSTEEILFGVAGFEPPTFPARVILSSCESGGAIGAGRGEWLGLTAVCLLRGARQVAATAWPIFDCPQTRDFEEEILEAIGVESDLAVILRNAQLRRLENWRGQTPHTSESIAVPEIANSPLVWAAFQCIGLAV